VKIVAFVPLKLNNERLPNKNTKLFDNGKPLLAYILNTLSKVETITASYVYCSDLSITQYLPTGIQFLQRSPSLDSASTKMNEIMHAFAQEVFADVYILTHATAPFLSPESIQLGIQKIVSEGYDSALTVVKMQDFFWQNGQPLNYDIENIPRTQDLEPMFVETTGLYLYKREVLLEKNTRIGKKPYLIEVSKIEATDINEPIDFEIANAISRIMEK
jgi:CMP-N-acetylneuraminic acid synthetase